MDKISLSFSLDQIAELIDHVQSARALNTEGLAGARRQRNVVMVDLYKAHLDSATEIQKMLLQAYAGAGGDPEIVEMHEQILERDRIWEQREKA